MAEAITAEQVAQVVIFIAPGFIAQLSYSIRFPRRDRQDFGVFVTSVVLSLPLVALANALVPLLGISHLDPTNLSYVLLLLGLSVLAGYLLATLRAWRPSRVLLASIGLAYQPESSIYAQTLLSLPSEAVITVEFTDGRKVSGTPRIGPGTADDGINELYLTNPAWWDNQRARWVQEGAGGAVIIPLGGVHSITLDRDNT